MAQRGIRAVLPSLAAVILGGLTWGMSGGAMAQTAQTITFSALPAVNFGTPPFAISASASSGLPVAFTSKTTTICTISGNTVTLVATGTCGVVANQAGNATYSAAQQVRQNFTVNQGVHTITFAPIANVSYGVAPFSVNASDSAGAAINLNSATPGVCTAQGNSLVVTIVGVGTCTLNANSGGLPNYGPATSVSQSFTVSVAGQTIMFPSLPNMNLGSAGPTAAATASSGLRVTYTSLTTGVCNTNPSGTVSASTTGTCTIAANQQGNSDYSAAAQVTQSLTVLGKAQTISFAALSGKVYGSGAFTLSASATSGLAVAFSSNSTGVCTVSGSTVSLVATGTCSISANQAGNTTYAAAPAVTQTFAVTQATQAISFAALANTTYGSAPFAVSATASSGLGVAFSSATSGVCTASGNMVTVVSGGTCTINASQSGNANYLAAPTVQQSFAVATAAQIITFPAIANSVVGTVPFAIAATASSGLPVGFASNSTSVCTISGSTVTIVSSGTCSISASQAGNVDYAAAAAVTQTFSVAGSTQTITFAALSNHAMGSAPFSLTASASSGLAVSFASTTAQVCTVSGSTVTLVNIGTCSIAASQAGSAGYAAAPLVTQSFTVTQGSQTISFGNLNGVAFGSAPFAVTASASSGLPVVFGSQTGAICTVSGSTVTLLAVGTCTIAADQPGNANFLAAPEVTQSFAVGAGNQTITFGAIANQYMSTSSISIAATASSALTVTFTSTTTAICTVSGTTVSFVAAGTCTIAANQAGNTNFAAAPTVTQSFAIFSSNPQFNFSYSPVGRVVQLSSLAGVNNQFGYDAVGNIVSVAANGLTTLSISQFAPVYGAPGQTVVVSGTGFDSTAANNTVTLGGMAATVTSASATSLSIVVPSGASSGPIVVTNSNGTATSASSFAVSPFLAAGNDPVNVALAANQTITLTFAGTAGQGLTLSFSGVYAPPGAPSISVTIAQPNGSALLTSACTISGDSDCTLPYLPVTGTYTITLVAGASSVQANLALVGDLTTALTMNAAAVNSTIGADQAATYTFNASAGQTVWVDLFGDTMQGSSAVQVYGPGGAFVQSVTVAPSGDIPGSVLITLSALPSTGVYSLRISHPQHAGGRITSQVTQGIPVVASGTGSATAINLAYGQTAVYTFAGTAGQLLNIALTEQSSIPVGGILNVSVVEPNGTVYKQLSNGSSGLSVVEQMPALPLTGTYVAYVTAGNYFAQGTLYFSGEVVTSVTPGGALATLNIVEPGEVGEFTFTATAGQNVTLLFNDITISGTQIYVYGPSGNLLATSSAAPSTDPTISLPSVSTTGTYTVQIIPGGSTGSISLQVQAATIQPITNTATTGTAVSANAGQSAYFSFTGSPGQVPYIGLIGVSSAAGAVMVVSNPDGTQLGQFNVPGPEFVAQLPTLAQSGTYLIKLTANSAALSGDISFGYDFNLPLGSTAPEGLLPLMPATFMFNGTAGQSVNLMVAEFANTNLDPGTYTVPYIVVGPNGSTLASYSFTFNGANSSTAWSGVNGMSCVNNIGNGCLVTLPALPSTGTYSVQFYPPSGFRLNFNVGVGPNLTGTIALNSNNNVVLSDTQNGQYTFSASAGQFLTLGLSNNGTASLILKQPDGTTLVTASVPTSANAYAVASHVPVLTQTGTYTVLVGSPPYYLNSSSTTNMGLSVFVDPETSLTFGGSSQTLNVVSGEAAVYTFSGTAGSTATLDLSAVTASGATFIPDLQYLVYQPNGTLLTSGVVSATGGMVAAALGALPATGTYIARIFPVSAASAGYPLWTAGSITAGLTH